MHYKKPAILIIFFFLIFTFPAFSKRDVADIHKYEDEIFKSFYYGDYYKLYDNIEKLLERYPAHPVSILYYYDLVRLIDVYGYKRIEKTINNIINKIKRDNTIRNRNVYLLLLRLQLEKLLYMFDYNRAKKITDKLNPVSKWALIGPFNKYGPGDIEYPFLPEIVSDYSDLSVKAKRIILQNPDRSVDIKKFLYPHHGIAYAITSFKTKKPVKIRIYSKSYYKLFINGKEVLKNIKGDFRNLRIIRIWNTNNISLMIKLNNILSWKFRVIITDENDEILNPGLSLNKNYFNNFEYTEELEYPYQYYIKKGVPAYRHLGIYYNELDSEEAVSYLKKALIFNKSKIYSYFLASAMIDLSNGNKSSAYYLEGWRIINELYDKYPDFIPVRYKIFVKLIEKRNFFRAFNEGEKLIKISPNYLLSHINFLDLLDYLGYEKEFKKYLKKFKDIFPQSTYPLICEANYHKKRDKKKYIKIYKNIIKKRFSTKFINTLINAYRAKGDYRSAIELINKHNYNDDFTYNLIDSLIKMKNYEQAKKIIFKTIIKRETPLLYYRLGQVDYLNNYDPGMYWQKMILLNPSLFNLSDYVRYLTENKMSNPFNEFINNPVWDKDNKRDSSSVIYRGRIFLLQDAGSSRVFCNDIIHLNDKEGIDRWGEYRVPFKGRLSKIRIRVYHNNGEYYDSYKIQKIDNENYINLNSLKIDSVVFISYIVDNPITTPLKSYFFSLPFQLPQNYDEPVNHLSIKIICPDKVNVNFNFKEIRTIKKLHVGDKRIYSIDIKNLNPVHREKFTGSSLNCLPYFSFSTMNSLNDFIIWYNGLIAGKGRISSIPRIELLRGKSVNGSIKNVYNFVSREISLINNLLYYPESADNIFFKKRGTVEDKVILAKAILKKFGIQSFIAFARKKYLPDFENFISPEIFSNILLYIPVDINKGLWLDFSNQHYSCGTVNFGISGADGFILLKNGYEVKKIQSAGEYQKICKYLIKIDNRGNAQCKFRASFGGQYGEIRKYFKNKLYHDNIINSYYSSIISSLNIDSFKIENLEDYEQPFVISAQGSGLDLSIIGVDKLIFQPILNKSSIYKYIRYPRRVHPLVISSPVNEGEEYKYILPLFFKSAEINKHYQLKSKFGNAEIKIQKKGGSNKLMVVKDIKIAAGFIEPSDYGEFLKFCMKLKRIEYQNIVIKK